MLPEAATPTCASCAYSTGPALPDPVRLRPQRNAVLLIGGDKTGNEQWYETSVPLADRLYERHLIELEESDDHGKSKKL